MKYLVSNDNPSSNIATAATINPPISRNSEKSEGKIRGRPKKAWVPNSDTLYWQPQGAGGLAPQAVAHSRSYGISYRRDLCYIARGVRSTSYSDSF
jgi:hypothetical protein